MSAPYREVSSRLKRLLTEGRVIEGSLYRSDRGNTPRHQLSDRATGRFRNIYVPADFAEDVAAWSAKLGGGEAPAEGDERDRPRRGDISRPRACGSAASSSGCASETFTRATRQFMLGAELLVAPVLEEDDSTVNTSHVFPHLFSSQSRSAVV